jgi:phosphonate transport system substrate-binding protein
MTRCHPGRLLFLLILLARPLGQAVAETERSFGVVPQQSTIAAAHRWQPLLNHLAQQTGTGLRFATASTITEYEERCFKGNYDYVYLSPLLYQEAQRRAGYRALVRNEGTLVGIIVVRTDGPQTLAELNNQTIAFPAPRAFGATLLTRTDLKRDRIAHHAVYLGTHESAYQAVIKGQYIAAGGVTDSVEQLPEGMRKKLRVLHATKPYIAHIIAVHPRVPKDEANRLQQTLLRLPEAPPMAALLKQSNFQRFVRVTAKDLEALRGVSFPDRIQSLSFHVIPRLSEEATRAHMQPLATYFRQQLELNVTLRTYNNMDGFEQAVYAERGPALINANPTQAIALIKNGYEVIAQQLPAESPEGMRGVLLVRTDSPYQRLQDLKGKRIAFGGNRDAFFSNVVPRVLLKRAGLQGQYIDASRPGPISDVLPRLAQGEVDAAATGSLAMSNTQLRTQYIDGKMRVIASSEPMPGLAWLVGPKFDPDTRDEIKHLLVQFDASAPGHAAFKAAGIERLLPANAATYAHVGRYLRESGRP